MNTLLENAIQEAMAELDKKSEGSGGAGGGGFEAAADAPKRTKKHDKIRKDKHHKRKLAPSASKSGEGTRLRSTR